MKIYTISNPYLRQPDAEKVFTLALTEFLTDVFAPNGWTVKSLATRTLKMLDETGEELTFYYTVGKTYVAFTSHNGQRKCTAQLTYGTKLRVDKHGQKLVAVITNLLASKRSKSNASINAQLAAAVAGVLRRDYKYVVHNDAGDASNVLISCPSFTIRYHVSTGLASFDIDRYAPDLSLNDRKFSTTSEFIEHVAKVAQRAALVSKEVDDLLLLIPKIVKEINDKK